MANNNNGLSKPLKTRTVLKNFKNDESQTFETLAQEYGMAENFEKFMELLHKVVGNENFSDMERINSKRIKKGKANPIINKEDHIMKARIINSVNENTGMKTRIINDLQAKAEMIAAEIAAENANTVEVVAKKERTLEVIKEEILNVEKRINDTILQRNDASKQLEVLNEIITQHELTITKLYKEIDDTKKMIKKFSSQVDEQKAKVETCENQISKLNDEKAALEEELRSKETVILFAPGKGGKIAQNMHYVSTYERQGVTLEKIPSSGWAFNWSMDQLQEKAAKYGYTDFNRLYQDMEFAQLVIYYRLNNKPFELVADHNPSVLAIIEDEWEKTGV